MDAEKLIAGMNEILDEYEDKATTDGCEYCRMEPNGDIPEDRKDLFNLKIGKVFDTDAFLSVFVIKKKLSLVGGNNYCKEVRIHYCPMCGRKL